MTPESEDQRINAILKPYRTKTQMRMLLIAYGRSFAEPVVLAALLILLLWALIARHLLLPLIDDRIAKYLVGIGGTVILMTWFGRLLSRRVLGHLQQRITSSSNRQRPARKLGRR